MHSCINLHVSGVTTTEMELNKSIKVLNDLRRRRLVHDEMEEWERTYRTWGHAHEQMSLHMIYTVNTELLYAEHI